MSDITSYVKGDDTTKVLTSLTSITQKLFTCFSKNQMKENHNKCHLRLSAIDKKDIQIANVTIKSSSTKKDLRNNCWE